MHAVVAPLLDLGSGVVAYEYDTRLPLERWLSPPVGDPHLTAAVTAAFRDTPPELNEHIHRRAGPITILSELLPGLPVQDAGLAPHARAVAMVDMFGINASDPSGRGYYFCAFAILPVLRHHLGLHGADDARAGELLVEGLRHHDLDPARYVPIVGDWLSIPLPAGHAPVAMAPYRQREVLLDALIAILSAPVDGRGAVILFEDLHRADPTTLELLDAATTTPGGAGRCGSAPLRDTYDLVSPGGRS